MYVVSAFRRTVVKSG